MLKQKIQKPKVETEQREQSSMERMELATDELGTVKNHQRSVRQRTGQVKAVTRTTKATVKMNESLASVLNAKLAEPEQLKVNLSTVEKIDLKPLDNMNKAVADLTRNTIALAAKENDEMNDLTEKMSDLSQKFSTNLDMVKEINSQCEETHKQIVPLLDVNEPPAGSDLNVQELIRRANAESDEIDEMLKTVDIEVYENNARAELMQISTQNQQRLDAFDAETKRLLQERNDEVAIKRTENKELKKTIDEKTDESNAIKNEINKTSALITAFREETSRINADIEDLNNNTAILDADIEDRRKIISELECELKQAEDETEIVKLELEAVLRAQQKKSDEIDGAVGNLRNLKNKQKQIEDLNEDKADEVTSMKKSIRSNSAKINEMQAEIDDTKAAVRKFEPTVNQAKPGLEESMEKERALKAQIEAMQQEMKEIEEREAQQLAVIEAIKREMIARGLQAELLEFYAKNAEYDQAIKQAAQKSENHEREQLQKDWEETYAKQNELLNDVSQKEIELENLDNQIAVNDKEIGKMTKEKNELKKVNEQIEALTEEEKVVQAELSRNRQSQLSSYENVANEAKKRMESCQVNINLLEKLKQKSAAFDKTPVEIEETKAEIDQLEKLKKKIDQVKDIKQRIEWCKEPDVNDN